MKNSQQKHSNAHILNIYNDFLVFAPVEYQKTGVEDKWIEGEDSAVQLMCLLMKSNQHSHKLVEEDGNQEEDRVGEKDQARQDKVSLTKEPLLQDISCYQVQECYLCLLSGLSLLSTLII